MIALETREVRCNCGQWLTEIVVSPMTELRQRLPRCPRCHRRGLPSTPILFVREGKIVVINWRGRVDPSKLPWPEG